jgi:hypothetical protein
LGSDFDRLVFATTFVPTFSCSACTPEGLTKSVERTAAKSSLEARWVGRPTAQNLSKTAWSR